MASPVDTSVKHYRSDMPGAPVLNGQAGSKIAQLDACLVTGYGLKSATLVVAGGIATLGFSSGVSAAWKNAVILVSGANNTALNGEQRVLSASTGAVTFATAQPDGTDAGSVTFKIAPAGWEKVYSKTNVAVYRSLSAESTGLFLRVNDTSSTFVRVCGYETMSDVDTGFGLFPTEAMFSGGGYWAKSDISGSAAVMWVLASDGRFFLDSTAPGSHRGVVYQNSFLRGFGDLIPKNPSGDAYLCCLNYSENTTAGTMNDGVFDGGGDPRSILARRYTGLGSAVACRRTSYAGSDHSGLTATFGPFPSPVDGSLILSAQYVSDVAAPRGDIPGHKFCPQSGVGASFKMLDTLNADGREYIAINTGSSSNQNNSGSGFVSSDSNSGASFIDITGPWR